MPVQLAVAAGYGDAAESDQADRLNWPVPAYSTVSRRQKTLQVAIEVAQTTTGLHLLVDSTGVKMLGEGEWKTKKHGTDYRRQWRKVHLGIDTAPPAEPDPIGRADCQCQRRWRLRQENLP